MTYRELDNIAKAVKEYLSKYQTEYSRDLSWHPLYQACRELFIWQVNESEEPIK